MQRTSVSTEGTWALWVVVMTGPALAHAGYETAGLTLWLFGVALQWTIGLSVLFNRRRLRRGGTSTD